MSYDRDRFEAAHQRLRHTPLELTDADLAQLALVDPKFDTEGREARKRAQLACVQKHLPAVQTKSVKAAPPETMDAFLERYGSKPLTFKVLNIALDAVQTATIEALKQQKDRIAALEQEIAALKATAYLKDAGLWRHGATYALGDVAQFSGSAWVCTKAHTASGPTVDHTCWRLWIKRGKDGKDAR